MVDAKLATSQSVPTKNKGRQTFYCRTSVQMCDVCAQHNIYPSAANGPVKVQVGGGAKNKEIMAIGNHRCWTKLAPFLAFHNTNPLWQKSHSLSEVQPQHPKK